MPDRPDTIARIEDVEVGATWTESRILRSEDIEAFSRLTSDTAAVHVDPGHAQAMGFTGVIAHGFLVASMYSGLLGMRLPGGNTVIHQLQLEMPAPTYPGDELTYTVTVERVFAAISSVKLRLHAQNQHGAIVSKGSAVCVFRVQGAQVHT
jgi:3-hydroxybutyryl-CoA dehydratase